MTTLKLDEISNLELQWQKLNCYEWPNQNSTTEFWINVFEYKNALNENPFRELIIYFCDEIFSLAFQ